MASIIHDAEAEIGLKPVSATRISGVDLIVSDLRRSVSFYRGLGFSIESPDEHCARQVLTFGDFRLGLRLATPKSQPYPASRAANDPWFQHFCIAVADMPCAFAGLAELGAIPVSRRGPQLLPPNTGSVIAYKFRDPDGHPLELSFIPGSDWLRRAVGDTKVFLGVDHTAIAVAEPARSIAFYERLSFSLIGQSLNTGIEQDRLDDLDSVAVKIIAMGLPVGPHLELLHYQTPPPTSISATSEDDVAAARTILTTTTASSHLVRDPDGHLVSTAWPTNDALKK